MWDDSTTIWTNFPVGESIIDNVIAKVVPLPHKRKKWKIPKIEEIIFFYLKLIQQFLNKKYFLF